jgi:hypothetical protein
MILAAIHKYQGDLDPKMWLLMTVFTHMQLVEYFLWKNLNVPDANRFWSGVGSMVLLLQPLISARLLVKTELHNKIWIAYAIAGIIYFATRESDLSTEVGGNGHLKWNWILSFKSPQAIAWLALLVGPMLLTGHKVAAVFIVATYIMSAYFNDKYGTAGSYWCWISIVTWLTAFIKT